MDTHQDHSQSEFYGYGEYKIKGRWWTLRGTAYSEREVNSWVCSYKKEGKEVLVTETAHTGYKRGDYLIYTREKKGLSNE